MSDEPALARRARALAAELGFERSSLPEVGALLRALAAARPGGRLAEVGTGTGAGTAWLADGLDAGARLVTVEIDPAAAAAAAELFADEARVEVVEGDWLEVLPARAPFDLVFLDGGHWKRDVSRQAPLAVELLAPGGTVVIDDLTPVELWPADRRGQPDEAREFWLEHPRLAAVEVRTTASAAAILATLRAE